MVEVISKWSVQRSVVRSIAWLGLSLKELFDFLECRIPLADTLTILTVRLLGADLGDGRGRQYHCWI